jgi:GNAT superfamily N-acetyltransferase
MYKNACTRKIKIRSVSSSDLVELTRAIKPSLNLDELTPELVRFRIFEDPDFDPKLNLAVFFKGRLVSFISAVHPVKFPHSTGSRKKAWIKVIFTLKDYRNLGYASELYRRILQELNRVNVNEVRFSDRGNWHFWPGIDLRYEEGLDFLLHRGFEKVGEEVDYEYNLKEFFYPRRVARLKKSLKSKGITTRLATRADREQLVEWVGAHFSPFWKNETEHGLARSEPIVAIAKGKNNNVLGFATCNGVAPGRFGPAGVDEHGRGKGIGTVLLFDAFDAMKRARQKRATVHWTDHLFYYTQVPGLSGVRHYWIMRSQLT